MRNTAAFTASDELLTSIDIEAFDKNETRAATIRRIVVRYLIEAGLFYPKEPTTHQQYLNNPFFVSRKDLTDE